MFSHHRTQAHPTVLDTTKPSPKVFTPFKKHRAHSESECTLTEDNYSEATFQPAEFQDPYQSACDFKAINEVSRVLGDWLEITWPAEGKTLHVTPTQDGILLQETIDEKNLISEAYSLGYTHAVEDAEDFLEEEAILEEEAEEIDPYLEGYNDALDDHLYNQGYNAALDDVELALQEEEDLNIYEQGYNDALEDAGIDLEEEADNIDHYGAGYNAAWDDVELALQEEEEANLYDQGYSDALEDVELSFEEQAENIDHYHAGYTDALNHLMAELGLDDTEDESIASQDSMPSLVSFSGQAADTFAPGDFEIENNTKIAASEIDYDDFSSTACEWCYVADEDDSDFAEAISETTLGESQQPELTQCIPTPAKSTLEKVYKLEDSNTDIDVVRDIYLCEAAKWIERKTPGAEGDMLPAFPFDVQANIRIATGNMEEHVEKFGIPYLKPKAALSMEWRLMLWKRAIANGLQMTHDQWLDYSKHYEMMERVLKNDPKLSVKEIQKFDHENKWKVDFSSPSYTYEH